MTTYDHNPYLKAAREFAKNNDLAALTPGKHVIDGDNLWVNIVSAPLRPVEKAKLEAHDAYIDLQIPLSGGESFGVKPRKDCTLQEGEMDTVNDIVFFGDKVEKIVTLSAGEEIVFAPDTAHAPLIGEGNILKAIFKIKVV